MWAAFEWEVSYLQGKGDVIIMGDLNACTGELNDWIKMDQRDNIPLPHEYTPDVDTIPRVAIHG